MHNREINPEIKEVFEETVRVTENSFTAINNIINYLSKVGSEHKGFKLLSDLFTALEWVLEVLEFIRSSYDDEKISTCSKILAEQMNTILQCMENEDYILLSDILEENVLPIIDYLNKVIKEEYL